MTSARYRPIPEVSIRRLPGYHRLLKELQAAGVRFVSCSLIGRELRLDPTQVRKDLEATGIVGKPKVGYALDDLISWLEDFLGWNNTKDAFLAGAGSLGSALMGYQKFRQFGLNIVAAFDTDPARIGSEVHGRQVLPLSKLTDLARRMHVHLGILAVPAAAAQEVADLMTGGGIRAIWNFAPVNLRVPDQVIVQNEDLYHSLASLSFKLAQRMHAELAARDAMAASPESGTDTQNNASDPGKYFGGEI